MSEETVWKSPVLIGLGGKLRAGKDAVADYLESEHDFAKMGMSDALNEALLTLNPLIPVAKMGPVAGSTITETVRYQEWYARKGYVEAKKNPEVRRLLQTLGTEVGRDMIDPDVWVKIARRKILTHLEAGRSVVLTAVRFPNELDMIRSLGGTTVWIERSAESRFNGVFTLEGIPGHPEGITASERAPEAAQSHASENSVSPEQFSTEIRNDGTLEDLYDKVEEVLRVIENIKEVERALDEQHQRVITAHTVSEGVITVESIEEGTITIGRIVGEDDQT